MISFELHRKGKGKGTARILLFAVFVIPCICFSQAPLDVETVDRERQLIEDIQLEQARSGFNSSESIAPLRALGLFFQERGDHAQAVVTLDRARQVVRVNYGLHTLDEAALIQQMVYSEEARGNVEAAWNLEQELLTLASRHPDDLRTAGILREIADKRLDVLARYADGEFPPQIILGCYYGSPVTPFEARVRGGAGGRPPRNCAAGRSSEVRARLWEETQSYYAYAARTVLQNDGYANENLPGLLMALVRNSYLYEDLPFSSWRSNWGRHGLLYLFAYEIANSPASPNGAEAMARIADWDLLHSESGKGNEAALEIYRQAYGWLLQHGSDAASIERIFSPDMPMVIPDFSVNPLITEERESAYMDAAFEITRHGRAQNIRIVDSADDVTRIDKNRLIRLIRWSRFRPRIVDGEFDDAAPVAVRYYLNGR